MPAWPEIIIVIQYLKLSLDELLKVPYSFRYGCIGAPREASAPRGAFVSATHLTQSHRVIERYPCAARRARAEGTPSVAPCPCVSIFFSEREPQKANLNTFKF